MPLAPALRYSPLGDPEPPFRTPLELHAPAFLACAASSLLSLLPSRAPSLSCCCWPPLAFFPPRPCSLFGCHCPLRCLLSFGGLLVPPPSVWFGLSLCLFGFSLCGLSRSALPVLFVVLVGFASCQLTEVTKDGRGPSAPTTHTHTPATLTSSPSLFLLEVGLSLIRLLFCLSWLSCCLVPLARLSCSVRGVGCSRPEPWTRLHCSELHWRDPVALSVGQPGAPVSSKACAHGSGPLFRSRWYPAGPLDG